SGKQHLTRRDSRLSFNPLRRTFCEASSAYALYSYLSPANFVSPLSETITRRTLGNCLRVNSTAVLNLTGARSPGHPCHVRLATKLTRTVPPAIFSEPMPNSLAMARESKALRFSSGG